MPDVPREDEEQAVFVSWLNDREIKHFRVPSETYTKSWSQKRKNKALGVVRGVPDLFVVVSPFQSADGEGYVLALEMKRVKLSTVSPEQEAWQETLNGLGLPNVQAYVAKGAEEAKRIVSHYLRDPRVIAL
jgi:hypothetical protein